MLWIPEKAGRRPVHSYLLQFFRRSFSHSSSYTVLVCEAILYDCHLVILYCTSLHQLLLFIEIQASESFKMPAKKNPSQRPPPSENAALRRSRRQQRQEPSPGLEVEAPVTKKTKRGRSPSPKPSAAPEPGTDPSSAAAKKQKKDHRPPPIATGDKGKEKAAAGMPAQTPTKPLPKYSSPYAISVKELDIEKAAMPPALKTAFAVQNAIGRPLEDAWKDGVAFATWYRHAKSDDDADMYVKKGKMAIRPVVEAAWIGSYGQIVWEDAVSGARRTRPGKANPPQLRRAVEVNREGEGEDARFSLVCRRVGKVTVNGQLYPASDEDEANFTVESLPEYAIIEVEDTVVFWFQNFEALDHLAPRIAALRAETWRDIFLDGTKRYPEGRKKPSQDKAHEILEASMLEDQDVVMAIASVWQTLRGQQRYFAFNEAPYYQMARWYSISKFDVKPAVYEQHDLLIPVILNDNRDRVSPPNSARPNPANGPAYASEAPPIVEGKLVQEKAHILLAIAQNKKDGTVNTIIMDSCPGYQDPDRIRDSVSKIVCQIGWKGVDDHGIAHPLAMEPVYTEQIRQVPRQEGIDACGIYTILNAWVYMLGLPRQRKQTRPHYTPRSELKGQKFPDFARRVMNRAMSGQMDLITIQAFLNFYGCCQLQDPDGDNVRLRDDTTARMTPDSLTDLLDLQRAVEQTQRVDIRTVVEKTKCSYDVARLFLDNADGNVDNAVASYRGMSGEN